MNKAKNIQKNNRPRQVTLYRNVFYSRVSTAVVLCLCFSFLLQPIERIYAADVVAVSDSTATPLALAVDAGLDPIVNNEELATTEIPETGTADTINDEAAETTIADEEIVTDDATTTEEEVSTDTETDGTSTTTEFTDEEIKDLIGEDTLPDFETPGTESTTTATTTGTSVPVSTVYSDAVMQFNKSDCVTVENGSFYCQTKVEQEAQGTDGMYSLQDKDGDLEIFVQKNGELTQITFNTVDDAAPYFDSKSNTIVWHRLIDDRYQIMSYDLDTGSESQLTSENVNNMEPSRFGSYTVWQRWNATNWDIVLYDGTEIKYLTDNSFHDIAPNIKGDLVMWNRISADGTQTIELYDINTKEFTTISDTEGGALSNPRMVLVYETEFANGDVVTKGYDIDTGEITPLATTPVELPDELPNPDSTGETRAMVQPKNPTKEDSELGDNLFPDTGASASGTPPVIESGDLIISSSSTVISAGATPAVGVEPVMVLDMTLDLTTGGASATTTDMTLEVPSFQPAPAIVSVKLHRSVV